MRLTSWNTRSLGNKSRGRLVGSLVNQFQVQFLVIQETMVKEVPQPVLNEIWKHYVFDFVQVEASGRSVRLLSIWNLESRKKLVWSHLKDITLKWSGSLCLLGDFNAFTWEGPNEKFSRIDRMLVNVEWSILWPDAILQMSQTDKPDHKPIIWGNKLSYSGPKPFRFNNSWFSIRGFFSFCETKWAKYLVNGWAAFIIAKKLQLLKADIKECITSCFEIAYKRLTIRIDSKHRVQSRYNWLKLGNKNPRFFHLVSRIKQQSSHISRLKINGSWEEDPCIVKEFAIDYFENLFTLPAHSLLVFDWVGLNLAHVPAHLH
ncbi:uncharacterized protein [Rutidosis leptorrhynchoides]|uniref:uncharacterized protein n=1 Tax=Rutidosis leptorrhynchoides TaxID=125765 RepID=UPI003A991A6D